MRLILVHGAWGSSTSWGALPGLLAAAGHSVEAVDLPGHGADKTPQQTVGLADYAAALVQRLRSGEAAVLIGHSMGGMAISAAAEMVPDRVRQLIYVAAFLPRDGDSLLSLKQREPSTIGVAVRPGPVPGTTVLDPDCARDILFQDLPAPDQVEALAQLGPQPNAAQTDRITLSADHFERVARDYILCTQDRTVTPWLQRCMSKESPCRRVEEIDCGHFPQLTAPQALAERLLGLLVQEA